MKPTPLSLLGIATLLLTVASLRAAEPANSAARVEFFEKKVRPLLADRCQRCHGPTKQKGGLRLDSKPSLLAGSSSGPVVVAGHPERSPLIQAVRYQGDIKMPPQKRLSTDEVATLTTWVKMGAPWPERTGDMARTSTVAEVRARHWSFRPVRKPTLPAVKDKAAVRTPVDAFVLARLEAKGWKPAPVADRRTLLRRVTFDLIGLPPTPAEMAAFEADRSPEAYDKVVDRLLANPHYGERWGRYWLDLARYADTKGYVFTQERRFPYAYTYRDYVIRAFNEDLPYDRFIREQIAADLLPPDGDTRRLAALGFLTLGRRFLNNVHDIIDDRIDVTMRGLQGLTVACARCHDHKFDPIPQKDYYSLYGVFASSVEPKELPLIDQGEQTPERAAFETELAKRKAVVEAFRKEHREELRKRNRKFRDQLTALKKKVEHWQATSPAAPPRAMALQDAPAPVTPHVFLRGNPRMPGPVVPRRFLEVVAGDKRQPFRKGSGRLELAEAIVRKNNPLTARVLVNRVWQQHFSQGLVRTPSDFGIRGEPPTHPELLDYLAATIVENGWSIKKLHRLILLSNTYRQASDGDPRLIAQDPDNRLLGRMNRRRLDFEALRDSLLAVAGRLDDTRGGKAVDLTTRPFTRRRSVYGFIDRQNLPGLFRTFDFASPDTSTGQRHTTTVPQQALFLMNSPFVVEQARGFSARPDVITLKRPEERVQRMYRLAFGRAADPDEVSAALRFLAAARNGDATTVKTHLSAWEQLAQVLLLSNEFLFVD